MASASLWADPLPSRCGSLRLSPQSTPLPTPRDTSHCCASARISSRQPISRLESHASPQPYPAPRTTRTPPATSMQAIEAFHKVSNRVTTRSTSVRSSSEHRPILAPCMCLRYSSPPRTPPSVTKPCALATSRSCRAIRAHAPISTGRRVRSEQSARASCDDIPHATPCDAAVSFASITTSPSANTCLARSHQSPEKSSIQQCSPRTLFLP
mmetsp:Transcript_36129/g.87330  ORF Transcript_36129/g.87330 Transcript_36129/m.87330 type:complete len:211 (+) Transcript_36129:914-1546(+)